LEIKTNKVEKRSKHRIQGSVPMVEIAAFVHKDYIDRVMHEVGRLESLQLTDAHASLEKFQEPSIQETSELSLKIPSLLSRVDSLQTLLKSEVQTKEELDVPVENLEDLLKLAEEKITSVEKAVSEIQNEVDQLEMEDESEKEKILKEKLAEISASIGPDLNAIARSLEAQQKIDDVKTLMVRTKNAYAFEGWIPQERLDETVNSIRTFSEGYGDIVYTKEAPASSEEVEKDYEKPPTSIKTPSWMGKLFSAFFGLTKAFGMPDFYEINPVLPFLITFPIVFGMMFGDIGHGLLLIISGIIFYLMRNKVELKPGSIFSYIFKGAPIIIVCGIAAMAFGFLYGEFFGSEEFYSMLTGLHEPIWFSPIHDPISLLKYSIMFGVFQISFGLILDLINKLSSKRIKEAIMGPIPWLWLYLSGSYLVFSEGFGVFKIIFQDPAVMGIYVLLPFGVLMLTSFIEHRTMGLMHALEALLMSFSHTVSYTRILALKMVHSIFSVLILPTSTIGLIIFPIGTVFLIGIFEGLLAFLHTLRLHWIEWFTKFYKGTGIPFKPFSTRRIPLSD